MALNQHDITTLVETVKDKAEIPVWVRNWLNREYGIVGRGREEEGVDFWWSQHRVAADAARIVLECVPAPTVDQFSGSYRMSSERADIVAGEKEWKKARATMDTDYDAAVHFSLMFNTGGEIPCISDDDQLHNGGFCPSTVMESAAHRLGAHISEGGDHEYSIELFREYVIEICARVWCRMFVVSIIAEPFRDKNDETYRTLGQVANLSRFDGHRELVYLVCRFREAYVGQSYFVDRKTSKCMSMVSHDLIEIDIENRLNSFIKFVQAS